MVRPPHDYAAGATVYELAAEFQIERRTVSTRLKQQGVRMRHQPPTEEVIDDVVELYASGLSLAKVGVEVGIAAGTVQRCLRDRGVRTRDTNGRVRN